MYFLIWMFNCVLISLLEIKASVFFFKKRVFAFLGGIHFKGWVKFSKILKGGELLVKGESDRFRIFGGNLGKRGKSIFQGGWYSGGHYDAFSIFFRTLIDGCVLNLNIWKAFSFRHLKNIQVPTWNIAKTIKMKAGIPI